jgi:hypothetical protein
VKFRGTSTSIVAICSALISCTEPMTPSTHHRVPAPMPIPKVLGSMQSLPFFSASLDAASGATLALPTYPFPEGVLVDMTIEGTVAFWSHPLASPYRWSGDLDAFGIRLPNDPGCLATTKIVFSQISGIGNPFPNSTACLIPRTMSNYSVRALVGGTGTATRGPLPSGNTYPCDSIRNAGDQCYTATGEQTITVTPLAATLDFQGTYAGVRGHSLFVPPFVNDAGDLVTGYNTIIFTDSTLPRGMPLRNLDHTWIFADPTDPGHWYWHKTENTCYAGNVYCAVNVKETGTMTSRTRVNGVEHQDSVVVYCTADTLLNTDSVRQALLALLDSSNAYDSDYQNRTERYFLILQDTVSPGAKPYIYFYSTFPTADVSQTKTELPTVTYFANTKVLAHGHSHPSEPNQSVTCHDSDTGELVVDENGNPITQKTVDGADKYDWQWTNTVNNPALNPTYAAKGWLPMPGFIIDKHNVFTLRPGQSLGDEHNSGNKFPFGNGRCKWPRR